MRFHEQTQSLLNHICYYDYGFWKKYHNNLAIPELTEDTVSMAMKSILKPSSGPKPKGNNLILFQEFQTLYDFSLEDGKNLSAVLDYYATTMITSITNNIKNTLF